MVVFLEADVSSRESAVELHHLRFDQRAYIETDVFSNWKAYIEIDVSSRGVVRSQGVLFQLFERVLFNFSVRAEEKPTEAESSTRRAAKRYV